MPNLRQVLLRQVCESCPNGYIEKSKGEGAWMATKLKGENRDSEGWVYVRHLDGTTQNGNPVEDSAQEETVVPKAIQKMREEIPPAEVKEPEHAINEMSEDAPVIPPAPEVKPKGKPGRKPKQHADSAH